VHRLNDSRKLFFKSTLTDFSVKDESIVKEAYRIRLPWVSYANTKMVWMFQKSQTTLS